MVHITQRDVAKLAGTSQATVSLVLNNAAAGRIAPATVERVRAVIRSTRYVANPAARQLAHQHNQIIGVFTYEPVFPTATADFYHPFLIGLEEAAQERGWDLLLFTSAPATEGRRRLLGENSRLRIADACVLLGREIDQEDLAQLNASDYTFVALGRRDDAGGPVPYVGADYRRATATVARRALDLGHRRLLYLSLGDDHAESTRDRLAGVRAAVGRRRDVSLRRVDLATTSLAAAVRTVIDNDLSCVFVEQGASAEQFARACRRQGVRIGRDLSVILLNELPQARSTGLDFTRLAIPRIEMGRQALDVLDTQMREGRPGDFSTLQRILPLAVVDGATLVPPVRRPVGTARTNRAPGTRAPAKRPSTTHREA